MEVLPEFKARYLPADFHGYLELIKKHVAKSNKTSSFSFNYSKLQNVGVDPNVESNNPWLYKMLSHLNNADHDEFKRWVRVTPEARKFPP